ncbi:hypothetical protein PVK06_038632 [Gossypium arboreum]|uniref:Leucine-rich repeat-containing N-terminal plant-type domain-containing protein n=1 Tax=Gossypium arboreum TaxID=29729 RepID=A0ABR0N0P7_GOSAR|nr:hypothetical protein PVK06_038632 [Gossypium arboreum]
MLVLMYILAVSGGSNGRCSEHEKQALLKFKEGLIDYGNLASWAIEKDCCRWRGFVGSLKELVYLNLSGNSISGIFPYWLGNLSRLLSLDDCEFPVVDPSSLSHINSSKSLAVLQLIDSIVHSSTFPLLLNMSNKLIALHL